MQLSDLITFSEEDEPTTNNETVRFNGSVRNVPNLNNHLPQQQQHSNNVHLLKVNKSGSKVPRLSPHASNQEITTDMSACSTPEPTTTVWRKTSQASVRHINNPTKKTHDQIQSNVTNLDNASMSICSGMESMPPPMTPLWRKTSQGKISQILDPTNFNQLLFVDGNLQKPNTSWSIPWTYANSELQRQDGANTVNSDSIPNPSISIGRQQPAQGTREWWQKKALEVIFLR